MAKKEDLVRKLRPTMDRVLVRLVTLDVEEKKSAGGIIVERAIIGDKVKQEQYAVQDAEIIAIGPWCYGNEACEIKEGDIVSITKYCGQHRTDIHPDGVYMIIKDVDIVGVYENEGVK